MKICICVLIIWFVETQVNVFGQTIDDDCPANTTQCITFQDITRDNAIGSLFADEKRRKGRNTQYRQPGSKNGKRSPIKRKTRERGVQFSRKRLTNKQIKGHVAWMMKFIPWYSQARLKKPRVPWGPLARIPWKKRRASLCQLKKIVPSIYSGREMPFKLNPLGKYMPRSKSLPSFGKGKSCAVVSSAGSMKNALLGSVIDKFSVVARMNNAPVVSHVADIGSKTTVRIINDQVLESLTKLGSDHITAEEREMQKRPIINIGWDFCGERYLNMPLTKCHGRWKSEKVGKLRKHGYNGLANYMRWTKYKKSKNVHVYVLDYEYIKALKVYIARESPFQGFESIGPSTGFIATAVLLSQCATVHLFHMIPPLKKSGPCKYDSEGKPMRTLECSLFPGHNREGELAFLMTQNTASLQKTYITGHAVLPGLSTLKCRRSSRRPNTG